VINLVVFLLLSNPTLSRSPSVLETSPIAAIDLPALVRGRRLHYAVIGGVASALFLVLGIRCTTQARGQLCCPGRFTIMTQYSIMNFRVKSFEIQPHLALWGKFAPEWIILNDKRTERLPTGITE
jgi:hypothetical protein